MRRTKHNTVLQYSVPERGNTLLRKGRGLSRRRALVFAGISLMLVIAIKLVTQPVEGHTTAVDVQLKSPKKNHTTKQLPASQTTNDYYAIDLPVGYHAESGGPAAGLLYVQQITKPGAFGTLIISIAVKQMPEGGISEDPSYRLRTSQPEHYRLDVDNRNGDQITTATDNQSVSVAAFWPHGSHLATIGITSSIGDPSDTEHTDEQAALKALLNGWHWR